MNARAPRCASTVLLLVLLVTACGPRTPRGPSLLIICLDTVRADLFYHPDIEDELSPWLTSAQAFSQAMTVAPWTLPTVATVFTGLYPAEHGAGSFPGPLNNLAEETPTMLSPAAVTLAEIARDEGYRTAVFSAHPWLKDTFGLDQGFTTNGYYKSKNTLVGLMLEWIAGTQGEAGPFFAYLHLMEPHDLHRGEESAVRARLETLDERKQAFLAANPMPQVCRRKNSPRCIRSQAYQASVLEAREDLAAILDSLQEQGKLDNTVVVVFSDHGEAFRERSDQHRSLQQDPRNMYGAGHGQYQFQELLHVPLLVWLPGQEGAEHSQRVSLVDIFPSTLHWLGLENTGPQPQGQLLSGTREKAAGGRTIYASNIAYGPETIAIFSGSNKAMYWPMDDRLLVFDLVNDPGELSPVEDEGLLLQFGTMAGDYLDLPLNYASTPARPDAGQLEDLQAIGYLQGVEATENDQRQDRPEDKPETEQEEP